MARLYSRLLKILIFKNFHAGLKCTFEFLQIKVLTDGIAKKPRTENRAIRESRSIFGSRSRDTRLSWWHLQLAYTHIPWSNKSKAMSTWRQLLAFPINSIKITCNCPYRNFLISNSKVDNFFIYLGSSGLQKNRWVLIKFYKKTNSKPKINCFSVITIAKI